MIVKKVAISTDSQDTKIVKIDSDNDIGGINTSK